MTDFSASLRAKQFYRFTGTPENWLTAIKYMTWGLKEEYKDRWQRIQPGDIFFIHSTGDSIFKGVAKSGIVGIGVVGPEFRVKENFLWIEEIQKQQNLWRLMVPFSEIYLFSDLPARNLWESPEPSNFEKVPVLIRALVQDFVPLSKYPQFPKMGSFSAVKLDVAEAILAENKPLFEYRADREPDFMGEKPTELKEFKGADETLRFADTLKVFENIRERIVKGESRPYFRNNELLARAESVHFSILQQLTDVFRKNGYETMFNRHVDLFAFNQNQSFLVEVKSTENRNFRSQARKGVVQLFEYDYFEIKKFVEEKKLAFQNQYKILVPSKVPEDHQYIKFINSLDIGVGLSEIEGINPVGKDFGFSKF